MTSLKQEIVLGEAKQLVFPTHVFIFYFVIVITIFSLSLKLCKCDVLERAMSLSTYTYACQPKISGYTHIANILQLVYAYTLGLLNGSVIISKTEVKRKYIHLSSEYRSGCLSGMYEEID